MQRLRTNIGKFPAGPGNLRLLRIESALRPVEGELLLLNRPRRSLSCISTIGFGIF
jgi:hypothetical protein